MKMAYPPDKIARVSQQFDPLDLLWRCCHEDKSEDRTLVVLVGHDESKLIEAIHLYDSVMPSRDHALQVVCNGSEPHTIKSSDLPITSIGPVLYRENTGWDIAMYADAVLKHDFKRYWFMNDDTLYIKDDKWLDEFEDKSETADLVPIQLGSPRNFRTTYFGCRRLFFLAWYVAIHYGVLKKDNGSIRRQDRKAAQKNRPAGYVQAKEFELYNLTFAKALRFKPRWLDDTKHFIDANGKARPSFLRPPADRIDWSEPRANVESIAGRSIQNIWKGRAQISVDDIIDYALDKPRILY